MQILLVEPDKQLASTYAQALEQAGHHVMVAYEAQAAIDAADRQLPELVILELQLIEHNGIEFLYEFRSYPEWQGVPVMVHSWIPPDPYTTEILQNKLNVTTCLYKPQTSLARLLTTADQYIVVSS